ncbi:MAG: UvrD-helicase domain-containing protein [Flavobacteriales bacterium]|nr:UvrD-helicase domain-containing protein [Flavobacteriales bacterium]
MPTAPKLKVLKASAGSGKTHALVLEYLTLALESGRPDAYRHILAITFTNAAAAEMTSRVLLTLRKLADGSAEEKILISRDQLLSRLNISAQELRQRASSCYAHILHHYGMLSISTMDAFTHRLVRSFAYELKVQSDFGIEMNLDLFKEELVDECLALAGNDPDLTAYLEQWVINNLREESGWNIRPQLIKECALLFSESTLRMLEKQEPLSLQHAAAIRKQLDDDQRNEIKQLTDLAQKGLDMIRDAGFARDDFKTGSVVVFLNKIIADDLKAFPNAVISQLEAGSFTKKGLKGEEKARHESLYAQLAPVVQTLIDAYTGPTALRLWLRKQVMRKMYLFGLISELTHLSETIKKERNILLIGDLQRLISRIVRESPTPFVYERLGERYHHCLFDEFQDTSEMQWENFVPLVVNGISGGYNSLLVGDAKQAIYRFRNGNAAQFVDLPHVAGNAAATQLFSQVISEEFLKHNYRSAKNIVRFNNAIYPELSTGLGPHAIVYRQCEQEPQSKSDGLVQIHNCAGDNNEERNLSAAPIITDIVASALSDGFEPGDITILVRKKKNAVWISKALVNAGYRCVTDDTYLLAQSHPVQSAIRFLYWLVNPTDAAHAGMWLHHLYMIRPEQVQSEIERWLLLPRDPDPASVATFFKSHLPALDFDGISNSNLYEILCAYFHAAGIGVDAYVEYFLDYAASFPSHIRLSGFLEQWEREKHKLSCQLPADRGAIQITTIHKSKGLEYPVVICMTEIASNSEAKVWVDVSMLNTPIQRALLKPNKLLCDPPPEIGAEELLYNLDEVNLFYVATTRAADRLYIINFKKNQEEATAFDQAVLKTFADYDPQSARWTLGERTRSEHREAQPVGTTVMPGVFVAPETRSEEIADTTRLFGTWLHEVMAQVERSHASTDLLPLISDAVPHADRQTLVQSAQALLNHQQLRPCFETDAVVYNERELVDGNGKILRPDRMVIYDDKVVVLDFKTGQPRDSHSAQLRAYADSISSITGLPCKALLAYVNGTEVMVQEVEE